MNTALTSSGIFLKLSEYFSYSFVRYAVLVSVLVALCSALLGVSLVLKRYSMIGDGLSHVAFGAGAVSTALGVLGMAISLPVTVLVAIFLLCSRSSRKIMGDAAIAMISAGSLAIGYLLLNLTGTSSSNLGGDVCTSLFGSASILTLAESDVYLCLGLSVAVIAIFVLFYNKLFAVTFDEKFSAASGVRVNAYNLLMAVITAVVIVVGMKLAGALLISALIIFPAMSAMRFCKSYKGVIIASGVISVVCSLFGSVAAILYETPVGATVVTLNLVSLAIFTAVGKIRARRDAK